MLISPVQSNISSIFYSFNYTHYSIIPVVGEDYRYMGGHIDSKQGDEQLLLPEEAEIQQDVVASLFFAVACWGSSTGAATPTD